MPRLDSHNMDDRKLTIEQRMFFALRKEKGLTLSCVMGGGQFDPHFLFSLGPKSEH